MWRFKLLYLNEKYSFYCKLYNCKTDGFVENVNISKSKFKLVDSELLNSLFKDIRSE